jgi:hypothetical protein
MKAPEPKVPEHLNPFAREVLEGLEAHPESQAIVLGGRVALQHHLDFRKTVDLAAWWAGAADEAARSRFPYRGSPAYHALRAFFGWDPVDRLPFFGTPYYVELDRREEREDGCENRV